MRQYEIWWANFPAPVGRRPVILLSRNSAYPVLNKFIAAEITTTIRDIPIELLLTKKEGMSKPCVVNCDNIRTISKIQLAERISRLPNERIPELKRALGYALEWEELISSTSPGSSQHSQ